MTCEEVKIGLHDYVDDLLDKKMRREMEEHIRNCASCYEDYNKIILYLGRLKDIGEDEEPPTDIIKNLSGELLERSLKDDERKKTTDEKKSKNLKRELKKQEKYLRKIENDDSEKGLNKLINKEPVISKISSLSGSISFYKALKIMLPLLLIGIGYLIYLYLQINTPWRLDIDHGYYFINGREDLTGQLDKGQILSVPDSSMVNVFVPEMGRIEVQRQSSITLLKGNNKDNLIKLESGTIRVLTTTLIPKLAVEVGTFTVKDIGGVFTIKNNREKNISVFVEFGLVKIYYQGLSYFVDEGYYCNLYKGKRPGTPYRFDASDSLKKLIREFDTKGSSETLVDNIVNNVSKSDALTLLALIPRVSVIQRQLLFQRLANFFPPPESVTRMGIITLDEEMLYDWWKDIEWQI